MTGTVAFASISFCYANTWRNSKERFVISLHSEREERHIMMVSANACLEMKTKADDT